jgi:hypothetical protein
MFQYYNPNPIREIAGDCVVRALCKAMGMSWDEAYWAVCFQGFDDGDMPSSNVVWRNLLIKNGFTEHVITNTCPDCYTVYDFCHDHPIGVYVLFLGGHVCCVKNGDHYDAFNSGDEAVIFYFRREW